MTRTVCIVIGAVAGAAFNIVVVYYLAWAISLSPSTPVDWSTVQSTAALLLPAGAFGGAFLVFWRGEA